MAFNQKSAAKTNNLNEKVKTARVNNVTTAGPKIVVSVAVGNGENVGSLTCLFAKAIIDESNLWHRRLGHINFKTMNKLVRGNLVRGLPSKIFENDHTCVACQKGKQHKASCIRRNVERIKDGCDVAASKKTNEEPTNKSKRNGYANSSNRDSTISPSVSTTRQNFTNAYDLPTDPLMPDLEDTGIFSGTYDDEDVGEEADLNNLETTMNVSPIPTTRIHKDHPKDQITGDINLATQTRRMTKISEEHVMVYRNKKDKRGIIVRNKARLVAQGYTQEEGIDYDEVFVLVARIDAIRLCLAYASFIGLIVYQMDVKSAFLYGTIEEEVYVCQPPGFEDLQFPNKVYKVEKALYGLHQALRAWYETLSTYILENGYRRGTIDKTLFIKKDKDDAQEIPDQLYEGAHFLLMIATSTPIETNKALNKDEEPEDVDVHLDRSMIGSLMFQVTPKTSHSYAVKRIFRYLKGQSKLGLWYPRDSPFDLEAFSDSDYAGASLDRKSTTGGCQFLGKRLISWQCKKQTIVANSTTEAEYVAAANCYGQVLWIQNQMLDYGFNFMNTKIHIDNESTICIVKNPVFHSKTKHIEIRHHFIRDSYEKKLIQVIKIHTDHNVADLLTKAFDVSRLDERKCNIQQKWMKDETVYKEWEDRMERAATTASSLEVEQDSGSGPRCQVTILGVQKLKLDSEEVQITATIDGKVKLVSKASIRRHLKLEDSDGITTLPNTEIFEKLTLMGPKKTAWEQFRSNIETAIICLATNRTFYFSKMIFKGMVKNLDSKSKFLMYPRFIQIFLNKHKRHLLPHNRTYIAPTLTQKLFSNMRRASKGYTGVDIPLFPTMLVQGPILEGEGSTVPVESHHTPSGAPTTSQPLLSSPSRIPTRQETEVPRPSSPTYTNVVDEAAFTSVDVIYGGAATTVSSIDAGQGSGNIPKSPTMPHDLPLPGGHTPGSDEGSLTLHELTVLCTKLSNKVDNMETELKQTKQTYGASLTKLIKKVKKLEQTIKTSQARKRANIVVSDDEESLEDTSKQGRMIEDINQDAGISLVTPTKKNVNTYTRRRRAVSTSSEGVSTASRIFSTAEESVSTAGASMPVSTVGMVQQVNIIIPSSSETTETTKDKGKALIQESEQPKKIKKKQEAKFNAEQEELLASETTEDEEEERENLSIEERARLLAELIDKRKKLQAAQLYEAIKNKHQIMSQRRKTMCTYMKNMAGYKMEHFKGKSFYEVKEMFYNVYKQVTSFMPMDSNMEKERTKRAGLNLQEESSKRQKTGEGSEPTEELKADEISQEDLQQMIMVVRVEEVYVEALQVKYPIIDWEVYSEDTRKYWKIIKVRNHTEAYQTFDDMLKKFDKDDLDKL
ncbi:putative ribonuclease H-like domain-containing protein [Tanacetum coccineum]